jgi:sugar phosphate isomerase/epimerase
MTRTRREFLQGAAGAAALGCLASAEAAQREPARPAMGVVLYSFALRRSEDRAARLDDPAVFLEHCRSLGAGGVQLPLGARPEKDAGRLRTQAEKARMYLEGIIRLPRDRADLDRFTAEVRTARACGATVLRTTLTDGRRYESHDNLEAFRKAVERGRQALARARPVVEKQNVSLAVENHKDLRSDELIALIRGLRCPRLGVCVDTGNSIALLESPQETGEALAPLALTVHIKDMGVEEYREGFRLAEVPLGTGFLDLPRLVAVLRKARPEVRLNLEMITRDPLRVPCLTRRYWATLGDLPGRHLAEMLTMVRQHAAKVPLPVVNTLDRAARIKREAENVSRSLEYARKHLAR